MKTRQAKLTPGQEVRQLRTLNSRTHWLGGDTFRLHCSLAPLHVPHDPAAWLRGDPVRWLRPDLRLRRTADGLRLGRAWYDLEIPHGWIGYRATSRLDGGTVSLRLIALDGRPVDAPRPYTRGGRLRWNGVEPGLDLSLRIDADCCEFFKLLHGPHAPREFTWELVETPHDFRLQTDTQGHDNEGHANAHREGTGVGRNRRRLRMEHERQGSIWVERWTGQTVALDSNRVPSLSDEAAWPVLIDSTLSVPIAADADDGDVYSGTDTWQNAYKPGAHAIYRTSGGIHKYGPGYRFTSVTLPQAASISSATVTVNFTKSVGAASTGGTLFGNAADDAGSWATSTLTPNDMTPTTANVSYPAFGGGAGTGAKVMDTTSIVQEIVNRGGWSSGNAMAFGVPTTTVTSSGLCYSYVTDRNGGTSNVAVLDVTYTSGGGSVIPLASYYDLLLRPQ